MPEPDSSLVADLIRQSLKDGQSPRATVVSDSMAPLLRKGDEILVEPAVLEKLETGSVVLLARPNELLAHRYYHTIEQIDCIYLITKGDRLSFFDPPHPARCLLGRVIARRRRGSVLSLDSGPGRRLGRWIAWLSSLETRFLRLDTNNYHELDISTMEEDQLNGQKEKFVVRFIRRLFYWSELIPALFVELTTR